MPDRPATDVRILEKPTLPKQIGYALVVVALVLLMLITTSNALYSPLVAVYSYGLIVAGIVLVVVNKVLESRLRKRLGHSTVYCLKCGWSGPGSDWYRSECCPECDAEEVVMRAHS
ncbi:MAG: hypothetical protein EHM23_22550 [Acidobacteria bacterium]|nr:MAG: hypothetical protein EHM23_22550 [Acidobacteriota bacterium]